MIKEEIIYSEKVENFLKKSIEYEKMMIKHLERKLNDSSYYHDYKYLNHTVGECKVKIDYYNYLLGILHSKNIKKSRNMIEEMQEKIS